MASNNVDVDDPMLIARANRLFGPYMGMELEIVARKDEHHHNEDEAELTHRMIVEGSISLATLTRNKLSIVLLMVQLTIVVVGV